MRRKIFLCFCLLFVLLPFNISFSQDVSQTVVATIGDEEITYEDFEKMVNVMPLHYQNMFKNKKAREDLLNQIVQTKLLAKDARSMGIDKDEEIALKIEDATNNILAREYIKREVSDKITITEGDIERYYKDQLNEFIEPEKIRARHILIRIDPKATPGDQANAEISINKISRRIQAGEDFANLAREFSEDPNTKAKGGDLGYISRGRMPPEFEEIAFVLKAEEVSSILKTQFGFHIVKLQDKTPQRVLEFNQVKTQITNMLKLERQRSGMDTINRDLADKYRLSINKEILRQ